MNKQEFKEALIRAAAWTSKLSKEELKKIKDSQKLAMQRIFEKYENKLNK